MEQQQSSFKEKERIERQYQFYQIIFQILSILVILIGLIVYIGQHAYEYKDNWDWSKFWLGVKSCTGNGSYETDIVSDFIYGVDRILK